MIGLSKATILIQNLFFFQKMKTVRYFVFKQSNNEWLNFFKSILYLFCILYWHEETWIVLQTMWTFAASWVLLCYGSVLVLRDEKDVTVAPKLAIAHSTLMALMTATTAYFFCLFRRQRSNESNNNTVLLILQQLLVQQHLLTLITK